MEKRIQSIFQAKPLTEERIRVLVSVFELRAAVCRTDAEAYEQIVELIRDVEREHGIGGAQ